MTTDTHSSDRTARLRTLDRLVGTWTVSGDLLTIGCGDTDSPARFDGRFAPDGRSNTGAWQWPGGGYTSTMTRVG